MSVGVLILKTHGTMKGPFLCPRFATGCGSPVAGTAAVRPGWEREAGAGGEVLESPEDTRTAATGCREAGGDALGAGASRGPPRPGLS